MTRKERIKEMARKAVGTGFSIKAIDVDSILEAGWDGITNGSVIYLNRLSGADKVYRKDDADTIQINDGPTVVLNDKQKDAMVDTYAMLQMVDYRLQ